MIEPARREGHAGYVAPDSKPERGQMSCFPLDDPRAWLSRPPLAADACQNPSRAMMHLARVRGRNNEVTCAFV
jgi:hypothetical protein